MIKARRSCMFHGLLWFWGNWRNHWKYIICSTTVDVSWKQNNTLIGNFAFIWKFVMLYGAAVLYKKHKLGCKKLSTWNKVLEVLSIPVDVEKSNKRALHQRRSVPYLVVTLLLLFLFFPLPQPPVLSRAMEPQHKHQQRQQHQAHGQGQQHTLQHARGTAWGCGETQNSR